MKAAIGVAAVMALAMTGTASAHPHKKEKRAPAVHPEIAAMIKSNQRSPFIPNPGLYEWRQSMDTHTGVPPIVSGSSQANPWVNREQYMPGSGMRRW
jgi:hypothetical protein